MKIKAQSGDLRKALSKLSVLPGAVGTDEASRNLTIGADLEGVQLFRFSATSAIRTNADCTVVDEGKAIIPFELLHRVLSSAAPGDIEIASLKDNAGVEVLGASGRSVIKAAESFHKPPPRPTSPIHVSLKSGDLAHAIHHGNAASASTTQSRPEIEGILLKEHDGQLYLTGTDGRRLHISIFEVTEEEALGITGLDIVLTKESVQAVGKLLSDEVNSQDIKLEIATNSLTVIGEQFKMAFALSNLASPNFMGLAQIQFQSLISVGRLELAQACRSALAFADRELKQITLTATKKYLQVKSRDKIGSEFEHKIAGRNDGPGVALDLTVNCGYMIDLIDSLRGDTITIQNEANMLCIKEPGKISILSKINLGTG